MTTQLQILKLDRAFDQLDVNAHGQIGRDDLIGLGARMILGFGQPPTSVKGKDVLEGYEKFGKPLRLRPTPRRTNHCPPPSSARR